MKSIISKYNNIPVEVKAAIWFLICSFFQKGISLITTPIFTRIMTADEYGNYNIFNSWENILIVFVSLNISAGVYNQGLVKYKNNRKEYSSSLLGLTLLMFTAWFLIYILFHNFFNNVFSLKTSYMILMFVYMFYFTIFAFWSSNERVSYNYKRLVIVTVISSILNPLLGIIFINYMDDKVFARILGTCVAWSLSYTWMFFEQIIAGKKTYIKKYWINAICFNVPLIPHYLSQTILNSSDRIMIGKLVDNRSAGIYGLAYSISLIMFLFNTGLSQTITPWIYSKIRDNKINEISKITYITITIIAIVNVILIALAPEIVYIFAPQEYYEAIYIIPPVAISVYFMFLYDLFAKFEFYYEKTKLIASATVAGALLNLILNYFCIIRFGYIAAGYTTLICYMLYALFHYIAMIKVCKEECNSKSPYNPKKILGISLIFICISFIFESLYKHLLYRYIFLIFLFLIIIKNRKKIINYVNDIFKARKGVN